MTLSVNNMKHKDTQQINIKHGDFQHTLKKETFSIMTLRMNDTQRRYIQESGA
jgi:hypothetical protein